MLCLSAASSRTQTGEAPAPSVAELAKLVAEQARTLEEQKREIAELRLTARRNEADLALDPRPPGGADGTLAVDMDPLSLLNRPLYCNSRLLRRQALGEEDETQGRWVQETA